MPVDPQIQRLLEARAKLPAIHTLSIADARTLMAAREVPGLRKPALADVREQVIDGPGGALRLRIYTPLGQGPFPLMVFFHGGGFVLCSRRYPRRPGAQSVRGRGLRGGLGRLSSGTGA